ncbi:MAG: CAP domain-containing protein, partial [Planctomycetota bacterium]
PGRRTPYDRMKLEGYEYGASENCVMGTSSPKGAHGRWCHSSGHHRNLLMPQWTEMGTGHYGYYMTQNFGRAPKWSKDDLEPGTIQDEDDEPDFGYGPEEGDWDPEEEVEESDETEFEYGPDDEDEKEKE